MKELLKKTAKTKEEEEEIEEETSPTILKRKYIWKNRRDNGRKKNSCHVCLD